jgi:hypothetical protein
MTEKEIEAIKYRFEELDDGTSVKITMPDASALNGHAPFEVTLRGVTWGMLEDIMNIQETAKNDPKAIFNFLNEYVEGGAKAIPIKRTMSFFQAISEYMTSVMNTQKN